MKLYSTIDNTIDFYKTAFPDVDAKKNAAKKLKKKEKAGDDDDAEKEKTDPRDLTWEGKTYRSGLHVRKINATNATLLHEPPLRTLIHFLLSGIDKEASQYILSRMLQVGDRVEIIGGESLGSRGYITSRNGPMITVEMGD
ncbi:hypothetical protein BD410DRAFT_846507, partial [Rickenella mellea]